MKIKFQKYWMYLGLAASLLVPGLLSGAQEGDSFPAQPELADYLSWAENHHPAMAGAAGRSAALSHRAEAAGALPDLRFGWGEMIVPVETRVGPQQRVLSLSQDIPWFGTLGRRQEIAALQADAAQVGVRARRLEVHRQVRAAWVDLAALRGEIRISEKNLALARQTEAAVRSGYESGTGSFGDVLAAQIEVEELSARLAGLRDRARPVTSRLNLAAGLDAENSAPEVSHEAWGHEVTALPAGPVLAAILEARNPELNALTMESEGRRQGVELAGKAGYPDLTLGVDYIMTGPASAEGVPDSGKDPVIARIGIKIPLWGGKAGAEKKEAAGWLAAASANLSDARRNLHDSLESVLYAWREADRNTALYGTVLLANGRQALEVTAARYRSGQTSYLELVTARNTLLGLELAHLRAETDRSHALNDLITLLGVSLTEMQAAGNLSVQDKGSEE